MGLQTVAEASTLRAMSALVYRIVSRKSDIYSELTSIFTPSYPSPSPTLPQ
jgi:hypothetical protein